MSNANPNGTTTCGFRHQGTKVQYAMLGGVFLTSFGVLALEVIFTRILSVILSYQYVFIVVSSALFGLSTGAIFVFVTSSLRRKPSQLDLLCWCAGLFSVSAPLTMLLVERISQGNILIYALIMAIPFFFAGAILAQGFRLQPEASNRVYFADMAGAGLGAVSVIVLLDRVGAPTALLVVALVVSGALLLFIIAAQRRFWPGVVNLIVLAGVLFSGVLYPNIFSPDIAKISDREMAAALNAEPSSAGKIVETRWSSFGRTNLVQFDSDPYAMNLYVDGTAGAAMFKFSGDIDNPGPAIESLKSSFAGYFPFPRLKPEEKNSALIIGPGGGRDVLVALAGGVREITAVEVNPDFVDIVKQYSDYNGGIYTSLPNVKVVVAEGRSFLRQTSDKFDIIMLSLPVTKTSRSPEGFALTENYLFTRESIGEYLNHLTDAGRLIVVAHEPVEVLRLISISTVALRARGIDQKEAFEHMYSVSSHMNSLFVLSKGRFTEEESYFGHQDLHTSDFYDPQTSYFPYVKQSTNPFHLLENRFDECPMLSPALLAVGAGLVSVEDVEIAVGRIGYDVTAVSDNSPFFYKLERGLPESVVGATWAAAIFFLACLFVPYIFWNRRRNRGGSELRVSFRQHARFLAIFSLLGVGFMAVEVSLIQRFTLLLGIPVLSVSVLLFAMLVGAGVGGLTSGRFSKGNLSRNIALVCVAAGGAILVYSILAPVAMDNLMTLSPLLRGLVSGGVLMPLGFLLGFPGPMALRLVNAEGQERDIPWLWSVNGAFSVLGSVGAVAIAMMFGLTQVLLVGALCYVAVSLLFLLGGRKRELEPGLLNKPDRAV